MKPNMEFPDLLYGASDDALLSDAPSDTEVSSDVPDPVETFFKIAELAACTNFGTSSFQHVHNFAVETAPINARLAAHYKKLAQNVAPKKEPAGDDHKLEKRASRKTVEETVYPSGTTVVAELENGIVVKTYLKAEAA